MMKSGSGRPRVSSAAAIAASRDRLRREAPRPRPRATSAAHRPGQLVAPAVVDGDGEVEAAAVAGARLQRLHQLAQPRRDPVAHADEADPHVVAAQALHLAAGCTGRKIRISPSTSASGRCQFSVEKA